MCSDQTSFGCQCGVPVGLLSTPPPQATPVGCAGVSEPDICNGAPSPLCIWVGFKPPCQDKAAWCAANPGFSGCPVALAASRSAPGQTPPEGSGQPRAAYIVAAVLSAVSVLCALLVLARRKLRSAAAARDEEGDGEDAYASVSADGHSSIRAGPGPSSKGATVDV